MQYLDYESVLVNRLIGFGLVSVIGVLTGIVGIIYIWINMRNDKPMFYTLHVLCVGLLIGSIVFWNHVSKPLLSDIKNHSFIVWEGEFTVEDEHSAGEVFVYLPDENGIRLDCGLWPKGGKHRGKVVYAKQSKVVVDIVIENKIEIKNNDFDS